MTKQEVARLCQAEVQAKANRYPRGSPLWAYYQSWADGLGDLATGDYDDPGLPFSCSREIGEFPHGREFVELWGREIGLVGSEIYHLAEAMKEALDKGR